MFLYRNSAFLPHLLYTPLNIFVVTVSIFFEMWHSFLPQAFEQNLFLFPFVPRNGVSSSFFTRGKTREGFFDRAARDVTNGGGGDDDLGLEVVGGVQTWGIDLGWLEKGKDGTGEGGIARLVFVFLLFLFFCDPGRLWTHSCSLGKLDSADIVSLTDQSSRNTACCASGIRLLFWLHCTEPHQNALVKIEGTAFYRKNIYR